MNIFITLIEIKMIPCYSQILLVISKKKIYDSQKKEILKKKSISKTQNPKTTVFSFEEWLSIGNCFL